MARKEKLIWFEPRWAYVPRLRREFGSILNARALSRTWFAALLLAIAIVAAFKWAVPNLNLFDAWRVLLAAPALVLYLSFYLALLIVIPPGVEVRRDWIQRTHSGPLRIQSARIEAASLTFHADQRIRLRLRYQGRARPRTLTVGVPPSVNLDKLVDLLPVRLVIRDARSRSVQFGAMPKNA